MVSMLSEDSTIGGAPARTACSKNVKPIESISEVDSAPPRYREADTWESGRQGRNFSCHPLPTKFILRKQRKSACLLATCKSQLHTNSVPLYVKFRLQP
jgi:hypothetical protein